VTPLHIKCEEWLHIKCEVWLHIKCEVSISNVKSATEWLLSKTNVKSDSSPNVYVKMVSSRYDMWKVTPLHIKCEEWLHSTSIVKSDYSLWQIWRVTQSMMSDYSPHQIWRVTSHHTKCKEWLLYGKVEEWLLSTSYAKSDSFLRRVTSNFKSSSPHLKWREAPLHIRCVEWLLSTCEEWLHSTSYVKSDSTLHQLWRVSLLYGKFKATSNVKSDFSPHQLWKVTPHV
jgi:hypothetical protein